MPFDSTTFVEESQVVKDLRAARALLDHPSKWVKGCLRSGGGFCIIGAANEVTLGPAHRRTMSDEDARWVRATAILHAIEAALPRCGLIADFNDARSTKHADIMDLFDRAIAAETKP